MDAIRAGRIVLAVAAILAAPARADLDEDVRAAVERGVAYLKSHQHADGTWFFGGRALDADHAVGVSALAGLALLEANVPAGDPVIEKAAGVVRYGISNTNATYDLSLAILFLDRLGQAGDNRRIEEASLSLAAGQLADGGWSYTCPLAASEADVRRLRTLVQQKNGGPGRGPKSSPRETPSSDPLPPRGGEARRGELRSRRDAGRPGSFFGSDNSNTQFATLALWVGRRHQLNVDRTLAAVEGRFRNSQHSDGGWGYKSAGMGAMGSTASMTCAGLLGLAVGQGVSREAVLRTKFKQEGASPRGRETALSDPTRDRAISRGLAFVGQVMEPALGAATGGDVPVPGPQGGFPGGRGRGPGGPRQRGGGSVRDNGLGSEYYFLWSLERVAVAYGLKTIGNKDWFTIGSRFLLETQENDGAWRGNLGDTVDTCFALFFLRRANLAQDLTATLHGKVPETVNLKAKGTRKEVAEDARAAAQPQKEVNKPEPATRKNSIPPLAPIPEERVAHSPPEPVLEGKAHDEEVVRLRDQVLKASGLEQIALVEELRDQKGAVNTDALADVIPRLAGTARTRAADALAERLSRMTGPTLRAKLSDKNREVRRAAALACALKEEADFVPDLIGLLDDPEPRVIRAAHAALKTLSHEDFGPDARAKEEERHQSIARWRQWWARKDSP